MNKTIYIQIKHVPLWDRAQQFAADGDSSMGELIIPLLETLLDKYTCVCGQLMQMSWLHCPKCGKGKRQ